jgi:hypothetical protein
MDARYLFVVGLYYAGWSRQNHLIHAGICFDCSVLVFIFFSSVQIGPFAICLHGGIITFSFHHPCTKHVHTILPSIGIRISNLLRGPRAKYLPAYTPSTQSVSVISETPKEDDQKITRLFFPLPCGCVMHPVQLHPRGPPKVQSLCLPCRRC